MLKLLPSTFKQKSLYSILMKTAINLDYLQNWIQDIAMSAGIFTNCSRGQAAQSLILSAISSPCCLLPVAIVPVGCAQRYT